MRYKEKTRFLWVNSPFWMAKAKRITVRPCSPFPKSGMATLSGTIRAGRNSAPALSTNTMTGWYSITK